MRLPCGHHFCKECVESLRKYGLKQVCPECRAPLPEKAEELYEQAARRWVVVARQVERRGLSWGTLPAGLRREMDEVIELWKTAAGLGLDMAQYNLGVVYENGQGVTKDEVEAVKWYRLAAAQNDADGQCN